MSNFSAFGGLSKETFVQIDKKKNKIEVTKNITRLFKKEVVLTGKLPSSLYRAAIETGIEPNVINVTYIVYITIR